MADRNHNGPGEQHQEAPGPYWFGHFGKCGSRIESYFADYMCIAESVVTLYLNKAGKASEDTLVAAFKLADGHSVRRLLESQLPIDK